MGSVTVHPHQSRFPMAPAPYHQGQEAGYFTHTLAKPVRFLDPRPTLSAADSLGSTLARRRDHRGTGLLDETFLLYVSAF